MRRCAWTSIRSPRRRRWLGSGGPLILDEDTHGIVRVALRTIKFYKHESCGWCIPCREGTTWLTKIMTRFQEGGGRPKDIDLVYEIAKNMLGRTFCPLGDAAAMPMIGFIEKFRPEFEEYLKKKAPGPTIPELALA